MQTIQSHTGLRGIAALSVVFYHLQFGALTLLPVETGTELLRRSYLFVDLFFILSGFILSYTAAQLFERGIGTKAYSAFMARRLIRLYPLLLFTLLYFVALAAVETGVYHAIDRPPPVTWDTASWSALLAQVLMINAWLPAHSAWNVASWSISAELSAYLLFPFAVRALRYFKWVGAAALLSVSLAFYWHVAATTGSLDIIAVLAPVRAIAGFLLGMLVFRTRTTFAAMPIAAVSGIQTIAALAVLLTLCIMMNDVWIVPPFVLLVATTQHDRGPLAWGLKQKPLQWLGNISYSVYLNHIGVATLLWIPYLAVAKRVLDDPALVRACWIGADVVVVLIVSHHTWRMVEVPARTWLTRKLSEAHAQPSDAAIAGP